jgi:hypothetical protein
LHIQPLEADGRDQPGRAEALEAVTVRGAAVGEVVCAALLRSTQTSRRIAPGLDEATINDFALGDAIDDAILVCLVS